MTNLTKIAWHDVIKDAPRPAHAAQDRAAAGRWLSRAAEAERAQNADHATACRYWATRHLKGAARHLRGDGLP